MKRLGRYTLLFERRPAILGHAAVCGKKEAAGPLARDFDQTFLDSYLNQESWEKAESMLQTEAANLAIRKAGLQKQDINMVFAGDLLEIHWFSRSPANTMLIVLLLKPRLAYRKVRGFRLQHAFRFFPAFLIQIRIEKRLVKVARQRARGFFFSAHRRVAQNRRAALK